MAPPKAAGGIECNRPELSIWETAFVSGLEYRVVVAQKSISYGSRSMEDRGGRLLLRRSGITWGHPRPMQSVPEFLRTVGCERHGGNPEILQVEAGARRLADLEVRRRGVRSDDADRPLPGRR